MSTPAIEAHNSNYKPRAFDQYTIQELGMWVHLLATRATHRDNREKRVKDLTDAQNYLDMIQERLNALKLGASR